MRFHTLFLVFTFLVCPMQQVFSQAADNIRGNTDGHMRSEEVEFIAGADVSRLDKAEDFGAVYKVNGVPKDALHIFKDHWFNYIRLMLWHTPPENYHTLEKTLYMAKRAKSVGLKVHLNIFYKDDWVDPGYSKPAAWSHLPFEVLKDSVYQYTRHVITALKNQNTLPDMVQIGNEIAGGFLWDDGRVGGEFDTPEQWHKFGELLNEAIRGIHESLDPEESVQIMIHIHAGSDNTSCRWFFDNLITQHVDFDVMGLSYYSWWHGTLDEVEANLNDLAQRYEKDIIIVETAYPWTLQWFDDYPNQVWQLSQLHTGYDASVDGQRAFLEDLMEIIKKVPKGKGKGIFYFSPEWISVPGLGCDWENVALSDFNGVLLPSIDAFAPPGLARISLPLNAASIPDTFGFDAFIEVRGEVNGSAPDTLPNGSILDWAHTSEIELVNKGGDYFEASSVVLAGCELRFKFWSQEAERLGLNGG